MKSYFLIFLKSKQQVLLTEAWKSYPERDFRHYSKLEDQINVYQYS